MDPPTRQRSAWALAARQHDVLTHEQLTELGFSPGEIKHRIATGRLHPWHRGVYAVGRPALTRLGRWMAAVLACGDGALLSHHPAAELYGIRPPWAGPIHVTVPLVGRRSRDGIQVHRRDLRPTDRKEHMAIPVTSPALTLVDLAASLPAGPGLAAVNEADKAGLIDPEELRDTLDEHPRRRGVRPLRQALDRLTYVLTDSQLERLFVPIATRAGLPKPLTQQHVNGFRVDFYWPQLRLVVETDGLTYHRTAAQQARDRIRDQAHFAAGFAPLRFIHGQVRFEAAYVEATLVRVAARQRERYSAG